MAKALAFSQWKIKNRFKEETREMCINPAKNKIELISIIV